MGNELRQPSENGSDEALDSADSRAVREVYGSERNISEHGSPLERSGDERIRYYFYPTWRSQLFNLIGFLIFSILCVLISWWQPKFLVLPGSLFSIGSTKFYLVFPVLSLLPAFMLSKVLICVYDAKYIIDEQGVEAQIGLVSMNLRQPRLRWEDIRGSEPRQTLWERILGIGNVLVGSAMTQDVEIVMTGVANPRAIQLLIQGERERRLRELRQPGGRDYVKVESILSD